ASNCPGCLVHTAYWSPKRQAVGRGTASEGFRCLLHTAYCILELTMIAQGLQTIYDRKKRTDVPKMNPGDTIRVYVKIKEGDKERLQAFEGILIARKNKGLGETITVRKVSFGQGVERIFPVHSNVIDHIDLVRTGRVR